MQRPRPARRIEARAGTVEPPVAQNEGFQWRSECLAFEASNAPDRNSRTARHFDTKQIIELCATVGLSNQVNRFHATFLTDVDTTMSDALGDSCPLALPSIPGG